MSAAAPAHAAIDAAIARGEWWVRLFGELSDRGRRRARALRESAGEPLHKMVQEADRVLRAVRLTLIATLRLAQILSGLADLRTRCAADIAAARARAQVKADEDAAAREQARDQARARREARKAGVRRKGIDRVDRARPEPCDRDPLVEALDKRLAAVDPAIVDFDDLQLRETVLRICADLGVTPDWSGWEAGRWAAPDTSAAAPAAAPPRRPVRRSPRLPQRPVLAGLPGFVPRPADTALSRVLLAGLEASAWRPPRLE